jgi:DNA-binding response OmpR family regulator
LAVHPGETVTKQPVRTVGSVHVVFLQWPREETKRASLARDGVPRLLFVDDDAITDVHCGELEDWVRSSAGGREIRFRAERLRRHAEALADDRPVLDEHGVLRMGDRWVVIPGVEARLMGRLLDRVGAVVSRTELTRAGWPQRVPARNALDVRMMRLRRRVGALGLAIRAVRSRGYMLEVGAVAPAG